MNKQLVQTLNGYKTKCLWVHQHWTFFHTSNRNVTTVHVQNEPDTSTVQYINIKWDTTPTLFPCNGLLALSSLLCCGGPTGEHWGVGHEAPVRPGDPGLLGRSGDMIGLVRGLFFREMFMVCEFVLLISRVGESFMSFCSFTVKNSMTRN